MNLIRFRRSLLIFTCISIITMSANSQQPVKNYDKEWKKVEGLTEKGLPQSALEEVKKIYALAKKEKQEAQVVKSLVHMIRLQSETRENHETLSIAELEKEIRSSREPVTALLKSLLAEIYWSYFQANRWKIYDRTRTVQYDLKDPATWDAERFHARISELYLQSLANRAQLIRVPLNRYEAIIVKGNVRHLRPTLYDLLAHRALRYFENDERDIKKPAYAFEISSASAFDPAADFAGRRFPTRDSSSLQHKALLIYQELITLHLRDKKPDALIDADLQRLQYVKSKSTHPDKETLYFNAIHHIARQYGQTPAAAEAWYRVANWYNEKANEYKPYGDSTHRNDRLKAKAICEQVLLQKDSSEGRVHCYNLLQQINKREFGFVLEKVNVPGLPFRSLLSYKNISGIWFRILPVTEDLRKQLENTYDKKFWSSLLESKYERQWEQPLPDPKDLQTHRTEVKIGALPPGEYVLLASDHKDFRHHSAVLGARLFYVSGISYAGQHHDYFVLDRNNGQPLAKATVQVWEQRYDYATSRNIRAKGATYLTDENGYFRFARPDKEGERYSYTYLFDISTTKDRLFLNEYLYDYYYNNQETREEKTRTSVFLFTDRSIYRPGQTLYYKGIVIDHNSRDKTGGVKTGYTTTVYLRDANYKTIDSIRVTTSEFGSFSGKFTLPQSGLSGDFSLFTKGESGQAAFKVEEYKRPKFYVEYPPIQGTYKVNDKIRVTGLAKAYAGNNIDGASVSYRVVRAPRFPYPWVFWRWWQPPSEEMEITHGEAKTDKDGKFVVEFTALPDRKIDPKLEPVFDFTIYADVTDINGETRSAEQTVTVGYKSLKLVTNIPERLPADSLKKLVVFTQNMNGEHEPARLSVRISRLKAEKRLIRERLWERPDQFVMDREEYIRLFPHDEYDMESDYRSWAKEAALFSKTDSSRKNGEWPMGPEKLQPGFYEITISTRDKDGREVKDICYIELYDEKAPQLARPAYIWSGQGTTTVEPGTAATIELGTSADSLFLIHTVIKGSGQQGTARPYEFFRLSDQKKNFSFATTEKDRGGFGANWMFIKHNRVYQRNEIIRVPWSNKQLQVEYATYRDKTQPGSEEKWKLRITGYQNEKLAAEMLASMYDASLDQFSDHSWSIPGIWPYFYNSITWNSAQNFGIYPSQQYYQEDSPELYADKSYDQLFSGEPMDQYFSNGGRNPRLMRVGAPAPAVAESSMKDAAPPAPVEELADGLAVEKKEAETGNSEKNKTGQASGDVSIRKNFNETAFFFPELRTDSSGAIEFSFTLPESLTRWKFMALAHTKDAAFGSSTKEIITQKDLMVQPNAPRFMREGDKMEFSTKVVNLTGREITGTAEFQLLDAETNEPVDGRFRSAIPNQYFTVGAGQSELLKFPIEVPYQFNRALTWRIIAKAGAFSDGEENSLPVLTNRMLVTESLPIYMNGYGSKTLGFTKLLQSGNSASLQHHTLTVEYTSNPAWYAIQALPYLMEYPYECAEQTWNRYYANAMATRIANSMPRIKTVFEQWAKKDTAALMSNLQKNPELKALLLEETPWVLQARDEAQQKRNIALLFDMLRMSQQLNSSYEKLKQMQSPNGGFVWFSGGPDDRYITQYIVTGIGHLFKLNAVPKGQEQPLAEILQKAIPYLDRKIQEDYEELIRLKADLSKHTPGYTTIQYLYMRSFFPQTPVSNAAVKAYDYFRGRMQQTWTSQGKYMQGMSALALYRTGDAGTAESILRSLKETAVLNEELGMYWKSPSAGWFWYQAPVETQALLIEVFQEAGKDEKTVNALKTWLLRNKQTNNWTTTRATAEACYALLLQGNNWLEQEPLVEIRLGNRSIRSTDAGPEAGTGYFKKTIEGHTIRPEMGNIGVKVEPSAGSAAAGVPSWGSVYWQYFEDLDKITSAATPLQLAKKLFIEKNTDRGPVLSPVNEGTVLKVGDKIRVRIELRVDRDMEYVHMKDMRASALEPVNVLSQYKWQGGLGYYESTRDASTNFFFPYLRKGTYVFEYPLFVTHTGNFSNGVTSIQCMYAPEFTAHSEGIRINVE